VSVPCCCCLMMTMMMTMRSTAPAGQCADRC
jgi:hypothetical protein